MALSKGKIDFDESFDSFLKTSSACLSSRFAEPFGYTLFAVSGILVTWSAANVSSSVILLGLVRLFPAWFLIVASVYVFNDIFDKELDRENNLDRPLAEGRANSKQALYLFVILLVSGLILSLTISHTMAIVSSAFLALGILYSLPSIRVKKRFFGKSLTLSIGFSLSLLAGGVTGGYITPSLTFVTGSIFVYIFFMIPLADLKDIEGDKMEGIRTLPNIIGQKNTLLFGLSSYAILPFIALAGSIFLNFNYIYILLVSFISVINIKKIFHLWKYGASQEDYKKLRNFQIPSGILIALIFALGAI